MRLLFIQRHELACNCGCGKDTFDVELSEVLEGIRNHFGRRVFVNSGNRCIEYNEVVQLENDPDYAAYSSKSFHMLSKAADIVVEGISSMCVYEYLNKKYPDKYGIGVYVTFVHVDVRPEEERW